MRRVLEMSAQLYRCVTGLRLPLPPGTGALVAVEGRHYSFEKIRLSLAARTGRSQPLGNPEGRHPLAVISLLRWFCHLSALG